MTQIGRVSVAALFMVYNLSGVVGKAARKAYYAASTPSERVVVAAVVVFFLIRALLDTRRDHDSIHGERCIGLEDV